MENALIIIDIAAAFAVSVLCGMGVGGGGLFVIYLTLCRAVPQLEAQGINLAFFICSALSSLILHLRGGRISLVRALTLGLSGAAGALVGSAAAQACDPSTLRLCFGFLLIAAAALVFFAPEGRNKKSPSP